MRQDIQLAERSRFSSLVVERRFQLVNIIMT